MQTCRTLAIRSPACWLLLVGISACAAPTEAELLQRIESPERNARLHALQDMARADNPNFARFFAEALDHAEPEFRRAAVMGLRSLHSPAARDAGAPVAAGARGLLRALDDRDERVRQLADSGLVELGADAVPPLLRSLSIDLSPHDVDVPWQAADIAILERASAVGPAGLPALVELLTLEGDENAGARLGAARVVETLGASASSAVRELDVFLRRSSHPAEVRAVAAAIAALGEGAAPARATLMDHLAAERRGAARDQRGAQQAVRVSLLTALGAAASADAVPLVTEFSSPAYPDEERIAAVTALGSIPGRAAVSALRGAMARAEEGTRGASVLVATLRAMGAHGDEASPALAEVGALVTHPDETVRVAAIDTVGAMERFAGPAAARALAPALADTSPQVRAAMTTAFRRIGPRVALPVIVANLGSVDRPASSTWKGALAALTGLGHDARPAMDDVLDFMRRGDDSQGAAAVAPLVAMGEPVLAPLLHMLRHPEEGQNLRALPHVQNALAGLGSVAVPSLIASLGDARAEVAHAARGALAGVGKPAVPALVDALRHSDNRDVQRDAIQTLGEIGPDAAEAAGALRRARENKDLAPYADAALRALDR